MSYALKLLCLSCAVFFLLHLALGLAAAWFTPAAIRIAARLKPRAAARFLFGIRLFPSTLALFLVATLCVPSYLWFEPAAADEDIGLACLAAALLTVAVWSISLYRATRAVLISRRYLAQCERTGREQRLGGTPAWIVAGNTVAQAGLLRSRLIVAAQILDALPADQLEAALRHECAHAVSRDNFKRLILLLTPDILPFFRARAARAEKAWAKFTEWSADDQSVAGDPARSLSLAAALVRVARMGQVHSSSPLITSLVAEDLNARVDRLLHAPPEIEKSSPWTTLIATAAVIVLAVFVFQPSTLSSVHELLERLIA